MGASQLGNTDAIKLLVEANADVNQQDAQVCDLLTYELYMVLDFQFHLPLPTVWKHSPNVCIKTWTYCGNTSAVAVWSKSKYPKQGMTILFDDLAHICSSTLNLF